MFSEKFIKIALSKFNFHNYVGFHIFFVEAEYEYVTHSYSNSRLVFFLLNIKFRMKQNCE